MGTGAAPAVKSQAPSEPRSGQTRPGSARLSASASQHRHQFGRHRHRRNARQPNGCGSTRCWAGSGSSSPRACISATDCAMASRSKLASGPCHDVHTRAHQRPGAALKIRPDWQRCQPRRKCPRRTTGPRHAAPQGQCHGDAAACGLAGACCAGCIALAHSALSAMKSTAALTSSLLRLAAPPRAGIMPLAPV